MHVDNNTCNTEDEVQVSPLADDGRRCGLGVPLNCLRRVSLLSIISLVAALDHHIISGALYLFKDCAWLRLFLWFIFPSLVCRRKGTIEKVEKKIFWQIKENTLIWIPWLSFCRHTTSALCLSSTCRSSKCTNPVWKKGGWEGHLATQKCLCQCLFCFFWNVFRIKTNKQMKPS